MSEREGSGAPPGCQKRIYWTLWGVICDKGAEAVSSGNQQPPGGGTGSEVDLEGSDLTDGLLDESGVSPDARRPARKLGAAPALALVAGSMLGIGIFITPAKVASGVGTPFEFTMMWLFGGIAALCGALALAELGAMLPRSGGDYAYLRRAWGPGVAYAAGWLQLLVIFPGSLASVAVATSSYQFPLLWERATGSPMPATVGIGPIDISTPHLAAALIILALTGLNHLGVKISGALQIVVTLIPLAVLTVSSFAVVMGGDHHVAQVTQAAEAAADAGANLHGGGWADFGRAYLGVYFAYSGWNAAIYVGGEIRNPGRNLPRALVGGTTAVTGVYLILCLGFLAVFGFDALPGVGEAGTAAASALYGEAGVTAITLLICLAMLGSLNGTTMIGSRIAFAMARKGDCFAAAGRLDRRFETPAVALWLQAGLALVLLFAIPDLDKLIDYTSSAMLITGTLTVLSVLVLRRREPGLARPYKVTAYPWPPLLYAASSVFVLILVIADRDPSVLIAVAWFALALVYYRFLRRARSK